MLDEECRLDRSKYVNEIWRKHNRNARSGNVKLFRTPKANIKGDMVEEAKE